MDVLSIMSELATSTAPSGHIMLNPGPSSGNVEPPEGDGCIPHSERTDHLHSSLWRDDVPPSGENGYAAEGDVKYNSLEGDDPRLEGFPCILYNGLVDQLRRSL